jgi:hypothetical protein
MMPIRLMLIMGALVITSCVSDVANRYYGNVRYSPKRAEEVEILQKRPSRDFTVIADFQSRGDTVAAMQEKAAQIGADAIIISILGGYYDSREQWAGEDRFGNTYSRITGTAIIYKK